MAAMQAAEALRAAGANVCDFGAGEPDFDTPENIKQAADKAMRAGRTKYTAAGGIRELTRAIIDFYKREFGNEYHPNEVMATAGGKQAVFNAVVTLLNPGDECLIPKPYWVTFPEIVTFTGAHSVIIDTEANSFHLTAEMVEAHLTPRSKLLIINSPGNPTGALVTEEDLTAIADFAAPRGILDRHEGVAVDVEPLVTTAALRLSSHTGSAPWTAGYGPPWTPRLLSTSRQG